MIIEGKMQCAPLDGGCMRWIDTKEQTNAAGALPALKDPPSVAMRRLIMRVEKEMSDAYDLTFRAIDADQIKRITDSCQQALAEMLAVAEVTR